MKNKFLLMVGGLVVGLLVGWQGKEKIEWYDKVRFDTESTNLRFNKLTNYYELGFRADGMVVWRKVTKETRLVDETNSPSEVVEIRDNYLWITNYTTNLVLTNLVIPYRQEFTPYINDIVK